MNEDSVQALRDLFDICLCTLDAPQEKHFSLLAKKLSALSSDEIRHVPCTPAELVRVHTVSSFSAGLFTARFFAMKYRVDREEFLETVEDMKKCRQPYMRLFRKYLSEKEPRIGDSWGSIAWTASSARYLYVFLRRIHDDANAVALVFLCLRKSGFLLENVPEAFVLAEKAGNVEFRRYVLEHCPEVLNLAPLALREKKLAVYGEQGDYRAMVEEIEAGLVDADASSSFSPSLQCLLIFALKKLGREEEASRLLEQVHGAEGLSPRQMFRFCLLEHGARKAFEEARGVLSKGEGDMTPEHAIRDLIRFSVPLSELLSLYLDEKSLQGRAASRVLHRFLGSLNSDEIFAGQPTPDVLAALSLHPLLHCDGFIARAVAVYYKKDILTFRNGMKALAEQGVSASPFFCLFQEWERSLDGEMMSLESYDKCTDTQREIFYSFLLDIGVSAQVFSYLNRYLGNSIHQETVVELYNAAFNDAKFGFCLYLLEQYRSFLAKNEKDFTDKKISCYKKMKSFYNIIREVERVKERTGEKAFDFVYIEALMKCGDYDKAYRALVEKSEELKAAKKQDVRLHRFFSLYYFHQGEYLKALKQVETGLVIKPEEKTLLEYKVKLLSRCGLKQEAVNVAKKLFAQRPVQMNFDMMMQMQLEALDESSADCVVFVNLQGEANVDECMSLALYYIDKFNRNTSFHVSHVVFLVDREGPYQLPSVNISFSVKMVFEALSFDAIKDICREYSMDWLGYMRVSMDMLEDMEDSLACFVAHGDREGAIIGKYLSLYRYEAVQSYARYVEGKELHPAAEEWFSSFRKHFLTIDKNIPSETKNKKILFITPRGISNFGGGEQFAMGISSIFEKNNFDIFVIAFSDSFKSSCMYINNTYFINNKSREINNVIYDVSPDVIWSFTWDEMKELVNSLKYIRANTIVGLHYYRSFFIGDVDGEFSCTEDNIVRRSFKDCLRYTDVVYANSIFTQRLILRLFHVALPVMFSLPHKFPLELAPLKDRKFVLEINTELKKGFDLMVQVAALLPHIPFVALSSQSSMDFAREYCRQRGVHNMQILPFQEDMGALYAKARVVAVPSYRFLETFSRVPIEAQHFGVPVLGSNTGNIPYLLEESGTVLPMDKHVWAEEIERLYQDDVYYEMQAQKAFANARDRYHFSIQPARIERFREYCSTRILVAMGSGVGNMVLATVAVRKLSEYYHTPVDIVTDSVPQSSAMMFANSPYVNAVYTRHELVRRRRYDLVFVTRSYSYGVTYSDFNAARICRTRDLFEFMDMRAMHESEMELKALQHYLNIPYEEKDLYGFTVCCNPYPPRPVRGRIGFHAGCKPGHWMKKQWPYFAELAVLLQEKGYEVISLGTPEEYVEGTGNATSYDTWDMVSAIQKCEYIVSNDSGVAHLAKALGVPGTILFGPTYNAKLLPYDRKWTVLHGNVPCMPCLYDSDFTTRECDRACMTSITVESVLASVEKHIPVPGKE